MDASIGLRTTSTIAATTVAAALAVSLVPIPETVNYRIIVGALVNAAHAPLFTIFTLIACWLIRPQAWHTYSWLWLLLAFTGGLLELAQFLSNRDPSWIDLQTNVLGATIGLTGWALVFSRTNRLQISTLAISLAALLAGLLYPVAHAIDTWSQRQAQFPVLFQPTFADAAAMLKSMIPRSDIQISLERDALTLEPLKKLPAGVEIIGITPDWQNFEKLVLDIENPLTRTVPVSILVGDFESNPSPADRFLTEQVLKPGSRQQVSILLSEIENGPANRRMPLDKISEIVVFQAYGTPGAFRLYAIWLE